MSTIEVEGYAASAAGTRRSVGLALSTTLVPATVGAVSAVPLSASSTEAPAENVAAAASVSAPLVFALTRAYELGAFVNAAAEALLIVALPSSRTFCVGVGCKWNTQLVADDSRAGLSMPPCWLPANVQCDASAILLPVPDVTRRPAPRLPAMCDDDTTEWPGMVSDVSSTPSVLLPVARTLWIIVSPKPSKSTWKPASAFSDAVQSRTTDFADQTVGPVGSSNSWSINRPSRPLPENVQPRNAMSNRPPPVWLVGRERLASKPSLPLFANRL